ncbi:MAG: hypothetical protein ACK5PS_05575 [Desulfopila sp.]
MDNIPLQTQILPSLAVEFSLADLRAQLLNTPGGERVLEHARPAFAEMTADWSAGGVYRFMKIGRIDAQGVELVPLEGGDAVRLALGWSGTFLQQAELVVVGGYTAGREMEHHAAAASREQRYLDSYLIEQVGLAFLAKTGEAINARIEAVAGANSWGVGPLLSPGSVHGWELDDQPNLCALLPLSAIGLTCTASGVLSPFNSLTFIIGVGRDYAEKRVGSPCEVCLNRQKCTLRRGKS